MNDKSIHAPKWVGDAIEVMPDELEEEELAAFLLTVIAMYRDEPRDVIPLILSIALTYSRTVGIPLDILQRSYQTAADGIGHIMTKEAGMLN